MPFASPRYVFVSELQGSEMRAWARVEGQSRCDGIGAYIPVFQEAWRGQIPEDKTTQQPLRALGALWTIRSWLD